jgi:hypothetical protein
MNQGIQGIQGITGIEGNNLLMPSITLITSIPPDPLDAPDL